MSCHLAAIVAAPRGDQLAGHQTSSTASWVTPNGPHPHSSLTGPGVYHELLRDGLKLRKLNVKHKMTTAELECCCARKHATV